MISILLQGFEKIELASDDPEEKAIITGVSWEEYEKLLDHLGDSSQYRLTYLEGNLEIMAPSRKHEVSKKNIARLLEVYLEEAEIDFWGLGSTTLRRREREAGKEPDECYCIGTEKEFPDIAIEVIVASGGTNILEVYRRLGVQEVWFWQNENLKIYELNEAGYYTEIEKSNLLPGLDLNLLSQYVMTSNPRLAIKEFRANLRSRLNS